MGKLGATLFALVFAVPFGGVGVFASYGLVNMFGDSRRATEWVVVQARVDEAALLASRGSKGGTTYSADGAYRYTFGGREYVSTRLGFGVGGSDNIGDWQESMAAFLEAAKSSGKTIPVFVNPDDPAEAVVDRDVRWAMVAFMGVFAVLFGGVGVGALAAVGFILFGRKGKGKAKARESVAAYVAERNRAAAATGAARGPANPPAIESSAGRGVLGLAIFALVWNLIAFPIGLLVTLEAMKNGNWLALAVLIFPLVGLLMIYSVVFQAISLLRRGKATLVLESPGPRMGARFGGAIAFARGGGPGREFDLRLVASRTSGSEAGSQGGTSVPAWWHDVTVRSAADPRGGVRLPFRFELPARLDVPGVTPGQEAHKLAWEITFKPHASSASTEDFAITVEPPREPVADLPPLEPTPDQRRNAAAIEQLLGAQAAAKLTDAQRASFAQLPPDAQAMVGKFVSNAGAIRKVAIGLGVGIAVLFVVASLIA